MRLIGNIEAKIDAKGRAFLPSVFRKVLQTSGEENLVLRKDVFEDCLVLYPESIWNEQTDLLRSHLNRYNAQHQRLWRQFVSEVELLTLDGNGRFLLPKRYLQMASIQQSIRFIGNGDTIEIWASEKVEAAKLSKEEFGAALQSVMGSLE
jgi:MraZ protein